MKCIALLSLECRIPHELFYAFNRITMPQFNIFCLKLSVLVLLISLNMEYQTCLLESIREKINLLEKASCIVKGRVGPMFNLHQENMKLLKFYLILLNPLN